MLAVVVVTAVLLPFAALAILLAGSTSGSSWMARRLWAPSLLWVAGVRLEVEGLQHVVGGRPTLYASNHQSTIDIPVLFAALPVDLRFVAKEQLRWVPLVGWYLQLGGHVLVDRGNRARAIASLDRAAEQVRRRQISLIVFPEGTRSPDAYILPFKHGPFGLALKAQIPVVPITVEGSARVMAKRSWQIRPGTIRVRIGAPPEVSSFDVNDRAGLARLTRAAVVEGSLALGGLGGVPEDSMAPPGLLDARREASPRAGML